MFREFFHRSPLLALPLVSLVIFITVFAVVIVRTFNRNRKPLFEQLSRLPLNDSNETTVPALATPNAEVRS